MRNTKQRTANSSMAIITLLILIWQSSKLIHLNIAFHVDYKEEFFFYTLIFFAVILVATILYFLPVTLIILPTMHITISPDLEYYYTSDYEIKEHRTPLAKHFIQLQVIRI